MDANLPREAKMSLTYKTMAPSTRAGERLRAPSLSYNIPAVENQAQYRSLPRHRQLSSAPGGCSVQSNGATRYGEVPYIRWL